VTFGGALGETLRLWRQTAPYTVAAALAVFVPLDVASAVVDPSSDLWANRALYLAITAATSLVATPWAAGAIVLYLDRGGSALGAYGKLEGRIRALVLGSWLAGIGTLVGLVFFVIPGLILAARWSLLVPTVVLERTGAAEGLSRSYHIVKGATGRVLAVFAVLTAIGLLIMLVPAVFAELIASGFVSSLVYGLAFDLVFIPLLATGSYVVHRQLTEAPTVTEVAATGSR